MDATTYLVPPLAVLMGWIVLGVTDVEKVAGSLRGHGAEAVGDPVRTPWGDFNQRLRAPDGMQLTLFHMHQR